MSIWNPVDWYDTAADNLESAATTVKDALVNVKQNVVGDLVGAGHTLAERGNSLANGIAYGAVATFETASGGVIALIDEHAALPDEILRQLTSTAGDVADFTAELYDSAKDWAETAWELLQPGPFESLPALQPAHDPQARRFAIAMLECCVGAANAEEIVRTWERDACRKGYTMAIDFKANVSVSLGADVGAQAQQGVYVDRGGDWGYFGDGVSATVSIALEPKLQTSLSVTLYMLFGGKERYEQQYYAIGADLNIRAFTVGGAALLTPQFKFAGFRAGLSVGVDYALFASGGNKRAKRDAQSERDGRISATPSLPGLDVYSTSLLGGLGSTYDRAVVAARAPAEERSLIASTAMARSLKCPTVVASKTVGGGAGTAFCDDVTTVDRITRIELCYETEDKKICGLRVDHYIDGSETNLDRTYGIVGTGGGREVVGLTLDIGEYPLRIDGRAGARIDYLRITTSTGRTLQAGGTGGAEFALVGGLFRPIIGFFGRTDGSALTQLGVMCRAGGSFRLEARHSGLAIGVDPGVGSGVGAPALQAANNNDPRNHWRIVSVDATTCRIVHALTGLYLADTSKERGLGQGQTVVLAAASDAASQRWQAVWTGDSARVNFKNLDSGLQLDVYGGFKEPGAALITWPAHDGANQLFRLRPVEQAPCLFDAVGHRGGCQRLWSRSYDGDALGFPLASARSLSVPPGWRLTVVDAAGERALITADVANFGAMAGQIVRLEALQAPVGARVYAGRYFTGAAQVLPPGKYDESLLAAVRESVSAVQVPEGWRVTLFRDAGFEGPSRVLTRSVADLDMIDFDDHATSLTVESDPLAQVVLYSEVHFGGVSQSFGPGRHDIDTLTVIGNDAVCSVKVPPGWTVGLYQHSFTGDLRVLKGDCADLEGFKRQTSSLVIVPG